jgi:hypothetical protein
MYNLIKNLKLNDTLYDLVDAVMLARLKEARKDYRNEMKVLLKDGLMSDVQLKDYTDLKVDVIALTHVIGIYEYEGEET